MKNLATFLQKVNQSNIQGAVWIDGSFLTEKLNPDDADMAFIITSSVLAGLTGAQRAFFDWFRSNSFYDSHKIDNYGLVIDQTSAAGEWLYAYWLRQFGFSRSNQAKGIISMPMPHLVVP
nr:hypothetical protein Hi04_10k_c5418_00011 [uncultured bacterium]